MPSTKSETAVEAGRIVNRVCIVAVLMAGTMCAAPAASAAEATSSSETSTASPVQVSTPPRSSTPMQQAPQAPAAVATPAPTPQASPATTAATPAADTTTATAVPTTVATTTDATTTTTATTDAVPTTTDITPTPTTTDTTTTTDETTAVPTVTETGIPEDVIEACSDATCIPASAAGLPSAVSGTGVGPSRGAMLPFTGVGDMVAPVLLALTVLLGGAVAWRWARLRETEARGAVTASSGSERSKATGYRRALRRHEIDQRARAVFAARVA